MSAVGVACAVAWAALPACQDPTQITLEVTTNVPCSDLRGTRITVGPPEAMETRAPAAATTRCDGGRVGALVIVPSDAVDAQVGILVVSSFGEPVEKCAAPAYGPTCIVARRALRYIANMNLRLPVLMSSRCAGVPCGPAETCVDGTCRDATIADPSRCAGAGCSEEVLFPRGDGGADAGRDAARDTGGGCSTDVYTDPRNCGSCGHDCLGGACTSGRCEPVVLASGQQRPTGIALAGGRLFWTDALAGAVRVCDPDRCTTTTVDFITGQARPNRIVTDGADVFWTNYATVAGGGGVAACPNAGCPGGSRVFFAPETYPEGLELDATNVYYTTDGAGNLRLRTCPRAGCGAGPIDLAAQGATGWTGNLAVDATRVFWTVYDDTSGPVVRGGLLACPKGGCGAGPTRLDEGAFGQGLALTATDVFWSYDTDAGTVLRAPKGGGAPQTLARGQARPREILADGPYLYWSNRAAGTVVRCAQVGCGGAPEVLASGQSEPLMLAADARAIYWTNYGGTTVMRVAK
jgi:hypothetical protein